MIKSYPVEHDNSGEVIRIGVSTCHCGINIGGVVNVPMVDQYTSGMGTWSTVKFISHRDIRGKFFYKPKNNQVQIGAKGRRDWIGWFELLTEPVEETATINTGRVDWATYCRCPVHG